MASVHLSPTDLEISSAAERAWNLLECSASKSDWSVKGLHIVSAIDSMQIVTTTTSSPSNASSVSGIQSDDSVSDSSELSVSESDLALGGPSPRTMARMAGKAATRVRKSSGPHPSFPMVCDLYTSCNFSRAHIPDPLDMVKPPFVRGSTPYYVITVGDEIGIFEASQVAHLPLSHFCGLAFETFRTWTSAWSYYYDHFRQGKVVRGRDPAVDDALIIIAKPRPTVPVPSCASSPSVPEAEPAATGTKFKPILVSSASPSPARAPQNVPLSKRLAAAARRANLHKGKRFPSKIFVHGDSDDTDLIPGPRYPSDKDKPVIVTKSDRRSVRGTRRSTPSPVAGPSNRDVSPIHTVTAGTKISTLSPASPSLVPSGVAFENAPFTQANPTVDSFPVTPVRQLRPRVALYSQGYDSDDLHTEETHRFEGSLRRLAEIHSALEHPLEPPSSPDMSIPSDINPFSDPSPSQPQFRGIILPLVDAANEAWLAKNPPPWRRNNTEDSAPDASGSGAQHDGAHDSDSDSTDLFAGLEEYSEEVLDEVFAHINNEPATVDN
ncbi:hypothetical protein CPC08DRAFT_770982 [Agrocybe pediades]|nr:hypothetical protein CPC08DRAFT_770982 [Agrocybe pediades]